MGDINGDGPLDFVAAGFISGQENIQTCINGGANTYTCSPLSPSSASSQITDAVFADFDNDLDLDLAVTFQSFFGGSGVEVFLNNSGIFAGTGQSIIASFPFGLDAGDLDGDGDIDLAVGNQASIPNQILFNNGTGTFTDSGQSLGGAATNSVVIGDIDLDGDLDLVAINEGHGGRGYVVYNNNGLGSFTEQEFGSNNFKHNGNLVDVDGDGDLDLVTGDYRTSPITNHAPDQVLINDLVILCDCGDGLIEGNEECDDGNTIAGDGCSATCTVEPGWKCSGEPSVCIPGPFCGNGSVDPGEECDGGLGCTGCLCDADFEPTAPPSLDCQPICGNGSIDVGEECDGIDDTACPGACLSDCTCGPFCGNGACDPGEDSCNCPGDCGTPPLSEVPGATCADGIDNDCDGLTDSADPDCAGAIPTVTTWGLMIMTLLLLIGAKVYFNRRRVYGRLVE